MDALKKTVLSGPESSGKSWLSEKLALHFKAEYIPEYARIYLQKHGTSYDEDIVLQIAQEHQKFQQQGMARAQNKVFLDTDMVNFRVWFWVAFGKTDPWIEKAIEEESDHRYLVLYPDLPWEEDPLREHPEERQYLFERHLSEVVSLGRPYRVIRGYGEQRLSNAIEATMDLWSSPKAH
ncbi:MAG: ATPase [Owenweeksia sp.]|nr:ATPase [Owenweeksia sp.]MBF98984.1 ATPase [Owenweeksia sp.]HBF19869.1 ATPase [Cryomorphaceae bacterium]HCQ15592.1 ATPase [Cryomorphaceae bacterium]|tara:strand:- start:2067 stop:2603 length:537 start_codon:yes stop_codon:yes gene_type:complete